jgi:predicted RNA-binding Zn ribbon-like protein
MGLSADVRQTAVPTITLKIANSGLARRPSGDRRATLNDPFATRDAAGAFLCEICADVILRDNRRVALSSDILCRLTAWRGALCRLLDTVAAGAQPKPEDLDVVNSVASPAKRIKFLTSTMGAEETILTEDPVAQLSALCIDELARCDPYRIKKCARPECAMYFYDQTRNRSARWHADDPCGWRSRDERRRSTIRSP